MQPDASPPPTVPQGDDAMSPGRENEADVRLAELAREGRERQAAALAADQAEERRAEREERRQLERLGRGNVRNALLDSPRGRGFPILRTAIAGVVAGTALLMLPTSDGPDGRRWHWLGLTLLAASIVGFFGGRWVLGRVYLRREREWIRSLPFPVRGYFRVLGETPEEERRVRVRFQFQDAAPARELLEGLVGRVAYPASARLTGGSGLRWTAESTTIHTYMPEDSTATNLQVLSWMRGMMEEVLLPLHEAYPLRGVDFGDGR